MVLEQGICLSSAVAAFACIPLFSAIDASVSSCNKGKNQIKEKGGNDDACDDTDSSQLEEAFEFQEDYMKLEGDIFECFGLEETSEQE